MRARQQDRLLAGKAHNAHIQEAAKEQSEERDYKVDHD
jgi:hypothetical protein